MSQDLNWLTEIQKKLPPVISICKKLKTIKKVKADSHKTIDSTKYSDIWGVKTIFNTIISYVDNKSLTQFNVVNKKIHKLTNPVIHRSLKLLRYNDIRKKRYNGLTAAERREAEVSKCIINNSKHAQLVKEIALSTRIKPAKTIEFFATFKFLTKLDINDVRMTQGQFIKILKPLTQLQELNINNFEVTERNKNLIKKGDMHLPSTLTKLTLDRLYYYDNPAFFIQFINSHNNLIEFKFNAGNFFDIFEPFQKTTRA